MSGSIDSRNAGAHSAPGTSPAAPAVAATRGTESSHPLELTIAGMTCGHCIGAVRDALEGLPGVEVDQVRIGRASVSFEPGAVSPAAVIEAIRDAGYQASFASDTGSAVGVQQKASLPQASTGGSCCSSH